jgi:hypothetical protein
MRISLMGLILLLGMSLQVIGQTSNSIYTDNTGAARYSNIDGSPYFYKEWYSAEVIASSGKIYTEEKVNFNGYTNQLEYYEGDEIKEMRTGTFLKVSVITEDGRQHFIRGIHAEFGLDLVCLLYDGQSIDFVKKLNVTVQEQNLPNATISKFIPSINYYLIKEGRLTKIPLKKKKILAVLKDRSEALEKYAEKEELGLKKEAEIIQLLGYYETLK